MDIPQPASKILLQYMTDQGMFGPNRLESNWYTTYRGLPDDPDACVAFYECKGRSQGKLMRRGQGLGGQEVKHHGVDVRIRHLEYDTAWDLGYRMQQFCQNIINVSFLVGRFGYHLQSIYRANDLSYVGEDKSKRRDIFSIDFRLAISFRGYVNALAYSESRDIDLLRGGSGSTLIRYC